MQSARVLWSLGLAVLVAGVLYGVYLGATSEGLAALAGPVVVLVATGASVAVLAAAVLWGATRVPALPRWMLVVTGVLSLVAAAGGLWIALEARVWLPWAVALAGLMGLASSGWAWTRPAA